MGDKGDKIICGIGTEHRLGRWEHVKGARNGIAIIKLPIGFKDEDVVTNGHHDDDDDKKGTEVKKITYVDAENWDKWDPKERGELVKDKDEDAEMDDFLNGDDDEKEDDVT